jgi:hypothetical protein
MPGLLGGLRLATYRADADSDLAVFQLCRKIRTFETVVIEDGRHGRLARGGHERPEVSIGFAMLDPSLPCRRPPLKWLYGGFRGGHLQGGQPAAVFYPLGQPMPYASERRRRENESEEATGVATGVVRADLEWRFCTVLRGVSNWRQQ